MAHLATNQIGLKIPFAGPPCRMRRHRPPRQGNPRTEFGSGSVLSRRAETRRKRTQKLAMGHGSRLVGFVVSGPASTSGPTVTRASWAYDVLYALLCYGPTVRCTAWFGLDALHGHGASYDDVRIRSAPCPRAASATRSKPCLTYDI